MPSTSGRRTAGRMVFAIRRPGREAGRPLLLVGGSEMSLTIPGAPADGAAKTTGKPVHVGAFPLRAPVEKHAPTWHIFTQLRQLVRPPLIVVNHPLAGGPERHWSEADVIAAIAHGATHLELNPRNHGIEASLGLWDAVLSRGQRVYGVLTNDAHGVTHIGRYGATLVQAAALTAEAIVAGLRRGACYALEVGLSRAAELRARARAGRSQPPSPTRRSCTSSAPRAVPCIPCTRRSGITKRPQRSATCGSRPWTAMGGGCSPSRSGSTISRGWQPVVPPVMEQHGYL